MRILRSRCSTSFQPPANCAGRPILPVYAAILFVYGRNEQVAEAREQKSALLTRMVLSVKAGIEIDFRTVDSLLALVRNVQAEEFHAMSDLVEFRHLKYIAAVAEAATITRAAEKLFLAQPSLSKQVKDFENELGFPIFIRTRQGVRITPPGQMIVAYAQEALLKRTKMIAMARAVHRGEVPPFRLGFSSFINPDLLQIFREAYSRLFPDCLVHLSGGDPLHLLHRLEEGTLDGALFPMPIDGRDWVMQQVARDPLVVCMQKEDPLARDAQVSLSDLSERLTVFRDPAVHPSAHNRLMEMLTEVGIIPEVSCSATTPADIQWMVRAGYGVALIDQRTPIDSVLTTRPIAGINWTADTAFIHHNAADHLALPLVIRFAQEMRKSMSVKKPALKDQLRPIQLELLA
jgi:DNA-binding transcriptional LysR family regulator